MSVLFVSRSKYHPEEIQPTVIVPYAQKSAILDSVKLGLGIQGLRPRMVKLDSELSYDVLFRELWAKGEPFILVEHDIIPWPGAVQELWTCPEPWCGFPYYVFGELRAYLGCTKFDPARLGECPLTGDLFSWAVIDRKIENILMQRGHKGHVHSPPVTHLNFAHVRQTSAIVEHPNFWTE